MSGIYGILLSADNSSIAASAPACRAALSKLKPWNMAYGECRNINSCEGCSGEYCHEVYEECADSPAVSDNDVCFGLGICAEHITSSPVNPTPVLKKDTLIAVIDAVLYNRDELVTRYGLTAALSDEEMLLELITNHGDDTLTNVNGDFCGAIYDTSTRTLTLFRDHMGVRPLFFYKDANRCAFSSDIRGLIAIPEYPAKLNDDWLYRALCGYDVADYVKTQFQDIFYVKPASLLTISQKEGRLTYEEHVYFTLGRKKVKLPSEKAYQEKLRELITDSVNRRAAVFPGKVGAELSGGLDSGVISILLARAQKEGIYYSWSFSPQDLPFAPNDERLVIADICKQENIVCNYGGMEIDMSPDSNVGKNHVKLGLKPDFTLPAEMMYAFPPYINTDIICETAQFVNESGGHVVFSGHGGDEGVSHRCDPFELYYHREYLRFFRQMWHTTEGKKLRLLRTLKQCYRKVRIGKKHTRKPFDKGTGTPQILQADFLNTYKDAKMPPLTFAFDSVTYVYSGNTHNRLDVAALLGAYSGARYVFPYVDYRVIDYAVSIPRYLYLHKNRNRYIYRQAFRDMMPESLYTCTAKDNPSNANLKQDTTDWFPAFNENRKRILGLLDREMWKDYLDFDFLDSWIDSPRPTDEQQESCVNIYKNIYKCFSVQTMIQRVRSI